MAYLGQVDRKASNVQVFNVDSSTSATHNIGWTPPSEQTIIVTINGVKQHTNAYSFSGAVLTLSSALVTTDELEVIGINDIGNSLTPVDGSVTTSKLGDDAVTLAKMAGLARGKIIVGDSSGDPSALTVGSANQVLKSDGTDAAWGADVGGSLVYLASSRSTVDAATVDFQGFKSTDYLFYLITGFMTPVTANVQLSMRLMDGASEITTSNYLYIRGGVDSDGTGVYDNSTTNDNWSLAANVGTQGPAMFSLQLHFQDATDDGWDGALLVGNLGHILSATGDPVERTVYGNYGVDNADLDGIRFYHNSGDIDYHKIVVYGMKGS